MALQLHKSYSMDDIIREFEGNPNFYCDNQFVVLPKVVLCFITVSKSLDKSHLSSPSEVVWRPGRIDYGSSSQFTWLPEEVCAVYDRSGPKIVKLRDHHVLVCCNDTDDYIYAGEAHLGSYGSRSGRDRNKNETCNLEANFSLDKKLPRDIWIKFGGYDWCIMFDYQKHFITTNDYSSFDKLIGQLSENDYFNFEMTRYQEDTLTIHTNPKRASLIYYSDESLYLGDPDRGSEIENFHCGCGIPLEFPAYQTTQRNQALQVAKSFFTSGSLPTDVKWSKI